MSAPAYTVDWPDWVLESDIASIQLTLMTVGESTKVLYEDMNFIDSLLESRPFDVGESRSGNERVLFSQCLCIYYSVDEEKKRVEVSKATYIQRKN